MLRTTELSCWNRPHGLCFREDHMRCPTRRRVALVLSGLMLSSAMTAAAELQDQTSRAYESYRASAEKRFFSRQHTPGVPALEGIIGRPGDKDGIISVAGGLIH